MKSIKIITKEETNAIREMYATGIPSQNALANHVGTSRYYIGKMVRDIVPDALRIRHSVYTNLMKTTDCGTNCRATITCLV